MIEPDNHRWAARLPSWAREHYEERAAIQEYEGGLPRAEAEKQARAAVEARIALLAKQKKFGP